jgi:polyhydroxyalkanoate synthesis regulator phasin
MNRSEFESFMRDVFGEPIGRFEKFRDDQWAKIEEKLGDLAKEAVHPEMSSMAKRLDLLEQRLSALEQERAENMDELGA